MKLTLVSISVLEKDRGTNGNEVKRGLNASSRSVKGASSISLDSRGEKTHNHHRYYSQV